MVVELKICRRKFFEIEREYRVSLKPWYHRIGPILISKLLKYAPFLFTVYRIIQDSSTPSKMLHNNLDLITNIGLQTHGCCASLPLETHGKTFLFII